MNSENSHAITRRNFCRNLALPAGALVLGSALPAWAGKRHKKEAEKLAAPAQPAPAQPEPAAPKYETKVLWDFDGLLKDSPNPKSNRPRVYNGNAYLIVILPGRQVKIVKVPLDGGKVQREPLWKSNPEFVAGTDNHRFYAVGIDAQGYIHVSGDMHQSKWVKQKSPVFIAAVFPLAGNLRRVNFQSSEKS